MTASDDPSDEHLKVAPPAQWATGVPAVMHALGYSLEQTSLRRTALTLLSINQPKGIDCPGCAWPEPETGKRHINEYCENGAKHINDEATTRRITRDFFQQQSISELASKSDMWLNHQGRLIEPMVKRPGSDHYEPISWDDALDLLAAGSATRRRSCCSSSRAGSAPTTCPTAATCATSPVVSGCRRRSASARAA
jgi:anaerobic selenocysteine-containing dehydrogenase